MYTTQQVIDMGTNYYDNEGWTRSEILQWLMLLLLNGYAKFDRNAIFDLIVG